MLPCISGTTTRITRRASATGVTAAATRAERKAGRKAGSAAEATAGTIAVGGELSLLTIFTTVVELHCLYPQGVLSSVQSLPDSSPKSTQLAACGTLSLPMVLRPDLCLYKCDLSFAKIADMFAVPTETWMRMAQKRASSSFASLCCC